MYYEINVSLNRVHFFATAERSIQSLFKLREVYAVLRAKFPESEGYHLSVTEWSQSGRDINPDKF